MHLVYVLFFLSGIAGLIYQVVWARLFHEVFGVSVYAVTTVLATFLAGLATGGFVLGRAGDRAANPLRLYGWLEIGIALTGLAGAYLVDVLDPLHVAAANRFAPDSAALLVVRVALAALVILPPTILMGGTLPVITRAMVRQIGVLGNRLGLLYALNAFGAVAGSLAAGFVLIRSVGLHPSVGIAAAINAGVGGAALALARSRWVPLATELATAVAERSNAAGERRAAEGAEREPAGSVGLLVVIALSGFVSLGLEVFWTRLLVNIVGTSAYAFVTMLTSFLVGISLGSFLVRLFVDRVGRLRPVFGWVQVGIAASVMAALAVLRHVDAAQAQARLESRFGGGSSFVAAQFGISFLLMFVPTTLIGMTFPLAGKMHARSLPRLGGEIGAVYGANTLGNILGAAFSGFVILPLLGVQRGVALLTVLSLACAGWGLLPERRGRFRVGHASRGAPVVLGFAAAAAFLLLWRPVPFTMSGETASDAVLYYEEGIAGTVKVIQRGHDTSQQWMGVDGIKIGESAGGVDHKQQVLAHFPFVLSERPIRRVLSIGLGTGILIGEVTRYAEVERVDCAEISPSVIEAAGTFEAYNAGVMRNPNVRIIADDGINFLRRTESTYDAIISDAKSRTTHSGNSAFFSRDYYRLCRSHLNADGVMIQWVPLDVAEPELRTIGRTFLDVFPRSYLWFQPPASCFFVGTLSPMAMDLTEMERRLDRAEAAHLRAYGWEDSYEIAGTLMADGDGMRAWLSGASLNTQERPILEFYSPRDYATPADRRQAVNLSALASLPMPSAAVRDGADLDRIRRDRKAAADLARGLATLLGEPRTGADHGSGRSEADRAFALIDTALGAAPEQEILRRGAGLVYFDFGLRAQSGGRRNVASALYERAAALHPMHGETRANLAAIDAGIGKLEDAARRYEEALRINPRFRSARTNLGQIRAVQGRLPEALDHFREAVKLAPWISETHSHLASALVLTGQIDEAFRQFNEAARLAPRSPAPLNAMAWVRATHPDPRVVDGDEAVSLATQAMRRAPGKHPLILDTLAAAYASAGRYDEAVATAKAAYEAATASGNAGLADLVRGRLTLYEKGASFRESRAEAMLAHLNAALPSR
jgi:spermidine synthase